VAVVRAPDKHLCDVPAAVIQLKEGEFADAAEILAHCKETGLYSFKLPKIIDSSINCLIYPRILQHSLMCFPHTAVRGTAGYQRTELLTHFQPRLKSSVGGLLQLQQIFSRLLQSQQFFRPRNNFLFIKQ
jgi:hypothetical protein